jgi:ribose transport system substrate-binding protein
MVAADKATVAKLMGTATISGLKPVKAPTGKTLGILSCTEAVSGCQVISTGATAAAKDLAWKSNIVDGKLTAQGFASGLQQLTAQKPSSILDVVIADSAVPSELAAAKAASIPVICTTCGNSLAAPIKTPSVANADVDYVQQGEDAAKYIIAETNGKANVAVLGYKLSLADVGRVNGFKKAFTCSGCKVVTESDLGSGADLSTVTRNAIQPVLAQYPKGQLDYIYIVSDTFTPALVQVLKLAGRNELKVVSNDCNTQSVAGIRAGGLEKACFTTPLAWLGWAGVDLTVRQLAGQPMATENVPFSLVTQQNAPPASATGDPLAMDYQSYYKKLWGLS